MSAFGAILPQWVAATCVGVMAATVSASQSPGYSAFPAGNSCIWISGTDAMDQVDTASNLVTRSLTVRNADRLLMNAEDCGIWVARGSDRALWRYDAQGILERTVNLRHLDRRLADADLGAVDASDGSLWVADEHWLAHISASGELLTITPLPGHPTDIQVALDRTVWILAEYRLMRVDQNGAFLDEADLRPHLHDSRRLWVDSLNDKVWVGGHRRLIQLDRLDPRRQPTQRRTLPQVIAAGALDARTGELWIATGRSLQAFDRDGVVTRTVQLPPLGGQKVEQLVFDPVDRNLWAAAGRQLFRFDEQGQLLGELASRDPASVLAARAFRVTPVATILHPSADGLGNDPKPSLQVGQVGLCNGSPCAIDAASYAPERLQATLNALPIGNRFVIDPSTAVASYTPTDRLPEGANSFTVQTVDRFGQTSAAASIRFAIDTLAPRFVDVAPPNGSVLGQPTLRVHGRTDEPAAVVFENKDEFGAQGANPQDTAFQWDGLLKPGSNTVKLFAIDRAGNTATQALQLTYAPPRVEFSIESPTNGASVDDDSLLVSGRFTAVGAVGITVNGIAAALFDTRFSAVVPLAPGANTITVVAATLDGVRTSTTLTVVATAPVAHVDVNPNPALAGIPVTFRVTASNPVTRIEADYDGDGAIDQTESDAATVLSFSYPVAGVYRAAFRITDDQNRTLTKEMLVVVQDALSVDGQIQRVYRDMLDRLRQRDIAGAAACFAADAAGKYVEIFATLGDGLAAAADGLGQIADGSIGGDFAEYLLVRDTPQGRLGFLMYFLRDGDGLWRIGSM